MTIEEYLNKILTTHKLTQNSLEMDGLRKERVKIEKLLNVEFAASSPTIKYGGSKAKNTMIKDSYDLDIICYFDSDCDSAGGNLKEIFNNVKAALEGVYFVEEKRSALRLRSKDVFQADFHVDVVPGRYVDDSKEDCYLHQAEGEKCRLKTNLDKHISHIRDSKLTDIISLLKLWKTRSGLELKTFVLELLVVKYVDPTKLDKDKPLKSGLLEFWNCIDQQETLVVIDPANPEGNDLSPIFTASNKELLKMFTRQALDNYNKGNLMAIFGDSEIVDDSEKESLSESLKVNYQNAPKPYSL